MGIRFFCPNGHKLHVKNFQAGQRGICPHCGVSMEIPAKSTRKSTKAIGAAREEPGGHDFDVVTIIQRDEPQTQAEPAVPQSFAPEPPTQPRPSARPVEAANGHAAAPEAPRDPLAGAGDVVWYVRTESGTQHGPATAAVIREWLAEGRIAPDWLVWREGWRDWRPAVEVFPSLGETPPAAAESEAPDAIPELQDILAEELLSPKGRDAARGQGRRKSAGSPIFVVAIVLGVGLAILAAVFLWSRLSS
jgi:hypothetical protein